MARGRSCPARCTTSRWPRATSCTSSPGVAAAGATRWSATRRWSPSRSGAAWSPRKAPGATAWSWPATARWTRPRPTTCACVSGPSGRRRRRCSTWGRRSRRSWPTARPRPASRPRPGRDESDAARRDASGPQAAFWLLRLRPEAALARPPRKTWIKARCIATGGVMSDLDDDYAGAGFGRPLEWGSAPAVLVVDMVRAYFEPAAELYLGSRDCLDATVRVLAAARAGGVPVIYTRVGYGPGGIDGGLFFKKVGALRHFVTGAGSTLGEIMPEIAPRPADLVITKQYASAFFGTSLAATLAAGRIDTLVVCGVSTSGCVRATAVDAISYGYLPVVVRQAVGDRDPRSE